ncbi:hypothetical protein FN846DRAFT_906591 [Sphaerosporella brunnea]|uniref:Uncharacterized protein n=1 Tax=Sphaerosporella brunnea TaxID=1250544 RepID=A0A5J5EYS9_9PEZI|nr:hypothetical protein FN846DRAFT_906591 [Sphaerosporella brunnea]
MLPLLASSLIGVQIALSGETGASPMAQSMKTAFMFGPPALSFGINYTWPAVLGWNEAGAKFRLYQLVTIDVVMDNNKQQVSAKGGLLDKLTGGADDPNLECSIEKFKESKEKMHKNYEENQKKKLGPPVYCFSFV